MRAIGVLWVSVLWACGGTTELPQNAPPPLPPPAWAADYDALVERGCECSDEPCLETTRTQLDAMVAERGGLDNAPAQVHNGHGRFLRCYRDGTRDAVRDLAALTDRFCACTDEGCVKQGLIDRLHHEDRYGQTPGTEEQEQWSVEDRRFEACKQGKIADGEQLAALYDRMAKAACKCEGRDCVAKAIESITFPADVVYIKNQHLADAALRRALEALCKCQAPALLSDVFGGASVSVSCSVR